MTLSGNEDPPGPEIHVAAGITTYLRFDAPLDKAAVEVEGRPARFAWVEVGDSLMALQPSVDLGAEETLVVRVRYRDGGSPTRASLALVTRPGVVDKEVEVVRRPPTLEALEAELAELKLRCAVNGPAGLVFSGGLDPDGVRARRLEASPRGVRGGGLEVGEGQGYRARSWAMAVFRVRNLPGQALWKPGSASLSLENGTPVKVRSLSMNKTQLAPDEEGLVAVETEAPFWKTDEKLRLELVDPSGSRRLSLPRVML